jgi:GNAT superfamily N-acetyltransferase
MPPELRRASATDVAGIVALADAAFAGYRSFAPPGWEAPAQTVSDTAGRLGRDGAWAVVASAGGAIVGVGAFEPAREGRVGELMEGLAHVWAVFVAAAHWGDGTATAILAALTREMRRRGFGEARLYTPTGQARARRFYAREGWTERGAPAPAPEIGLELVELRRAL